MTRCHCCDKELGAVGKSRTICSECIANNGSVENKCSRYPHKELTDRIVRENKLLCKHCYKGSFRIRKIHILRSMIRIDYYCRDCGKEDRIYI